MSESEPAAERLDGRFSDDVAAVGRLHGRTTAADEVFLSALTERLSCTRTVAVRRGLRALAREEGLDATRLRELAQEDDPDPEQAAELARNGDLDVEADP